MTYYLILYSFHIEKNCRKSFNDYFLMISNDQDNSRETLSFHITYFDEANNIFYFFVPRLDLFKFLIIHYYVVPKDKQNWNSEILGSSQRVQKSHVSLDHHSILPHIHSKESLFIMDDPRNQNPLIYNIDPNDWWKKHQTYPKLLTPIDRLMEMDLLS